MCFEGFTRWVFRPLLLQGQKGRFMLILEILDGDRAQVFSQHTLYGSRRDSMAFGDLPQALPLTAFPPDSFMVQG